MLEIAKSNDAIERIQALAPSRSGRRPTLWGSNVLYILEPLTHASVTKPIGLTIMALPESAGAD